MNNENNKKITSDWVKAQFKVEEQIVSDRRNARRQQQEEHKRKRKRNKVEENNTCQTI